MTQNYEVNLCIIWWLVPVASREALDEGVRFRQNQTSRCVSPVSPPVQSSWIQSIGGAKAFVDALVCSAVPLILIDDSGASHPFTNTWTLDFRAVSGVFAIGTFGLLSPTMLMSVFCLFLVIRTKITSLRDDFSANYELQNKKWHWLMITIYIWNHDEIVNHCHKRMLLILCMRFYVDQYIRILI